MSSWIEKIFGPIFVKEMLEVARRKRHYFNRVLYGAALLLACWFVWADSSWEYRRRGQLPIQEMTRLTESLFRSVCVLQFFAIYLFVPITIAGVIAAEREANSLGLLFTTHLTNREIVFGKLASRLMVTALPLCGAVPVLSLITLFGGIDPISLVRVSAVTLLSMLFVGSHAIYFSATTKTTFSALLRTYWWLALLLFLAPACVVKMMQHAVSSPERLAPLLPLLNPLILSSTALYAHPAYAHFFGSWGLWLFPLSFVAPTLWSMLLLLLATARLRRLEQGPSGFVQRTTPLRSVRDRWSAWSRVLSERRRRRADRVLWRWPVENPLWLRARRGFDYDRGADIRGILWIGWLIVLGFIVYVGIYHFDGLRDDDSVMALSAIVWFGIGLLTMVASANGLVADRRRGFLELVWTTPLEAREIVDGSLLSVAHHLRPALLLPWVFGFFCGWIGKAHVLGIACSLITGTLFVVVLGTLGVLCSLLAKQASAAAAPIFAFGFVVCFGLPVLLPAFGDTSASIAWALGGTAAVAAAIFRRRGWMVPAIACGFTGLHIVLTGLATFWVDLDTRNSGLLLASSPGFWTIEPLAEHPFARFPRFAAGWYLAVPFYWLALVANVLLARRWTIRHFDELIGRVPQRSGPQVPTDHGPSA